MLKDVRVLLCSVVRMSRVIAAREKMSAGVWGFGWGSEEDVWEVWEVRGLVNDGARDWADLEWRREEGGFGKRVDEGEVWGFGDVMVDVFEEEDVEVEIIDGAEGVCLFLRDQKDEMRCFIGCGDVAVASVWVDDAAEEASEKRVGEPMRITVPFEAAEFGLVPSWDAGGLSFNVARARRVGRCLRFVRPPD